MLSPRPRRFLFFPKGNNSADQSNISLYLDHVAPKEDASWGLCVQFVLTTHSEDDSLTTIAARGTNEPRPARRASAGRGGGAR